MRPRDHGTIVQVGSALAYRSIPLQSAYCAAKAAIRGFTDSLRCELLHDGSRVRLTHVHLPAVNTPQAERCRALAEMYIMMYIVLMSQRYSIAEARSRLPAIVDQAESGTEVELTRRGQPVAVVVSRRELERLRGKRVHFGDAYRKFLVKHSLEDIGIDDDFAAAVRDRSVGRKVTL